MHICDPLRVVSKTVPVGCSFSVAADRERTTNGQPEGSTERDKVVETVTALDALRNKNPKNPKPSVSHTRRHCVFPREQSSVFDEYL